jgi:hypothetical protein
LRIGAAGSHQAHGLHVPVGCRQRDGKGILVIGFVEGCVSVEDHHQNWFSADLFAPKDACLQAVYSAWHPGWLGQRRTGPLALGPKRSQPCGQGGNKDNTRLYDDVMRMAPVEGRRLLPPLNVEPLLLCLCAQQIADLRPEQPRVVIPVAVHFPPQTSVDALGVGQFHVNSLGSASWIDRTFNVNFKLTHYPLVRVPAIAIRWTPHVEILGSPCATRR